MSKYTHINVYINFYDRDSRYVIMDLMEGTELRGRTSSNHYKQQRYLNKFIRDTREKWGLDLPVHTKEETEYNNVFESAIGPVTIFGRREQE